MRQEVRRSDYDEILGIEDGDEGEIKIIYRRVTNAQTVEGIVKREIVGVNFFTTITMSVPMLVGLNRLLVERYGSNPPDLDEFLRSHAAGIVLCPAENPEVPPHEVSIVLMRPAHKDDRDESGRIAPAPCVIREDHVAIVVELSNEAAWTISEAISRDELFCVLSGIPSMFCARFPDVSALVPPETP